MFVKGCGWVSVVNIAWFFVNISDGEELRRNYRRVGRFN